MGFSEPPRFAGRTAWRALIPAKDVAPEFREPLIHLWLGRDAHLVHYPVKGGSVINVVVIIADDWNAPGWSEPASRIELLPRLSRRALGAAGARAYSPARSLAEMGALRPPAAAAAGRRDRWRCSGTPPIRCCRIWRRAPPWRSRMRPWRRNAWRACPTMPTAALRTYSAVRRARTRKVQRLAARNGERYHLAGVRGYAAQHGNARRSAARGCCTITIGFMIGGRPPRCRSPDRCEPDASGTEPLFPDHDRRQPAETGLARRAEQAVGAVAARRRRARRRQGRRHAARASSCRRTPASTSSATASSRASISCTAFSKRSTASTSTSASKWASATTATRRCARPSSAPLRLRSRVHAREARLARAHTTQEAQIHPARPDDHRRHHRRRPLRRPGEDGDRLCRAAQRGGARARRRRRRRDPVRRAGLQRLHGRRRRLGHRGAAPRHRRRRLHQRRAYLLRLRHPRQYRVEGDARRRMAAIREILSGAGARAGSIRSRSNASIRTCR